MEAILQSKRDIIHITPLQGSALSDIEAQGDALGFYMPPLRGFV